MKQEITKKQKKGVPLPKDKAVAIVKETEVGSMIRLALDKDLDIEKLKALIALKNEEELRLAKKEFEFHFSEMQKELVPVEKTKHVKKANGDPLYSYAPLEDILLKYSPIITKHGFSYTWDQVCEEGNRGMWCIVSGWGYSKKTFVPMIIMQATSVANGTQQIGSAISYAKRYSFQNLFGVIVKDEDDDGVSLGDKPKAKPIYEDATIITETKKEPHTEKSGTVYSKDGIIPETIHPSTQNQNGTLSEAVAVAFSLVSEAPAGSRVVLGSIANKVRTDQKRLLIFIGKMKGSKPEEQATPAFVDFLKKELNLE